MRSAGGVPDANVGAQDFEQDLECIDDPRTGPVEILITVRDEHARAELFKVRLPAQPVHFLFGAREVEPAGRHDNGVGPGRFHHLGVDFRAEFKDRSNRPIPILGDGEPIRELVG